MIEYARTEFELSKREGDGASLRAHLQRLADSTGRVDDRLTLKAPRVCEALWGAFLQLSATRQAGMGTNPISMTEVESWCRLQGVTLTPWEVDTLLAMDGAALNEVHKK